MTQILMLDAAYPPGIGQLITDITTVGAHGAFQYVWGPIVNWSPAYRAALQNADLYAAPIIVPGNNPGDPNAMLQAVEAWGYINGPVLFDFEAGSEPSNAWWDGARDLFRRAGYHPDRYGTSTVLGLYDPGDADWIANWIHTGILEPVPTLPPGEIAWQFVNDVTINNTQYDVSVVDVEKFALQQEFDHMQQGFKVGLAHTIIKAIYQREPTQQELFDLANTMHDDGSNLADLVQGLVGNTAHPDLVMMQNEVLNERTTALETEFAHFPDINLRPAVKKALTDAANEL